MQVIIFSVLLLGLVGCASTHDKSGQPPVDLLAMKPLVYCVEDRLASGGSKLEVALITEEGSLYSVHRARFEKGLRENVPAEYIVLDGMDCGVKTNSLKAKSGVPFQLKTEKVFCAQKVVDQKRERKEVLIMKNPDNQFYDISEVTYRHPDTPADSVEIVQSAKAGPVVNLGTKLFICDLPAAK